MTNIEANRRKRESVCSACGWDMVMGEHRYTCANAYCSSLGSACDAAADFDDVPRWRGFRRRAQPDRLVLPASPET